jgi:hypothetical protein
MDTAVAKKSEDRHLRLVECWPADSPKTQGHPKSRADLFEHRRGESGVATGRRHPLNATAPLFDESECMEDAANHTIPAVSRCPLAGPQASD